MATFPVLRSALIRSNPGAALWRRRQALLTVTLMTFFISTELFSEPDLFEFWSLGEAFFAWLEFFAELLLIAFGMTLAFHLVDQRLSRRRMKAWQRLPFIALAMFFAAAVCTTLIGVVVLGHRVWPISSTAFSEPLRWSVLGFYVAVVNTVWRRARDTGAQAQAAEASAERLARDEQELQLQLLKAQIEPHFLFNTLANMRRLYRLQPESGAQMMVNLKGYLHAALPGVRNGQACLHDEMVLAQDYLALLQVRMGPRLRFSVVDESGLGRLPFPPLVVLTLVENAIRHGLEPAPGGGHVEVRASLVDEQLRISVADDGVGLQAASTGGTGVGLANIRRQLQACYGRSARLRIESAARGVIARIEISQVALAQPGAR